jgi:hypothetical protein
MKCPACFSEIDDRSYRCKECHRIASYRRFCWRYRYFVLVIVALIGYWTIPGLVRRWFALDYNKLPHGALVSDQMTLAGWGWRTKDGSAKSHITKAACCICDTTFFRPRT